MSKIKGITIEFNGNVLPLKNGISKLNAESNKLTKELKAVEKGLKLNPESTELLAQKQEILAETIKATKDKLDSLKNAEKSAQEQFKKGTVSKEEYRKLQREIDVTKSNLKKLSGEIEENVSKWDKFSTAVDKVSGKASKLKDTVTPLSVAVAGVGTAGVVAFNEVDNATDTLLKSTGATKETAEKLKETYKNVAQTTPFALESIGSSMGEINTRFGFVDKQLESATVQFEKFAEITGIDATEGVKLVSRAMGDAGIKNEEYVDLLDQLAKASQISGISVQTLTDSITKYGAPMRALGFDTKESIAIFSSWEKAGVNTEIAFSGMKQAIGRWGSEGKNAKEEFTRMLDEIGKAPDIATATSKSIEAFGVEAGPDLADAIKGGRFEFGEFLKQIESGKGTVNATYSEVKSANDDVTTAINNFKIAGSELGAMIMEQLSPIINFISDEIKKFSDWFNGLNNNQKKVITTIGALIIALPILIGIMSLGSKVASFFKGGIGNLKKGMGALKKGVDKMKNSQLLLNAAMWANPYLLISVLIVGLIIAFVILWNKCEGFRNFFIDLGNKMKEIWDNVVNFISDGVDNIVKFFKEDLPRHINNLIENIKELPGKVIDIGKDIVKGIFDGVSSMADWFKEKISDFFNGIFGGIGDFFGGIGDFFTGKNRSAEVRVRSINENNTLNRAIYKLQPLSVKKEVIQKSTPTFEKKNSVLKTNDKGTSKVNTYNINLNIDKFVNEDKISVEELSSKIHRLIKRKK